MPAASTVKIGALKQTELEEAGRIVRLAFGTFLGLPDPAAFFGDRDFLTPRWHSKHVEVVAARDNGKLIGTNVITRWGSFGFFGPLTILPDFWDRGVAQRLLEATMKTFDAWGVRHTGLFTFPNSAKHIALYQKFGYWPRFLTAILEYTPQGPANPPAMLSALPKSRREAAIRDCAKLTNKIDKGLDLTGEIRALLARHTGDVVLTSTRGALDAFAVCMHGAGSEGGESTAYIKFGAARSGAGAGERFSRLLDACDGFAKIFGAKIEAGMNLSHEDAYRRMRAHGYRAVMQGVAMHRPNADGFNHADTYVIDDWR